jgi:phage anti-repressor protein
MKDLKVIENELVPVMKNNKGEQLVDGRILHEFLKIQRDFSDWIKNQLELVEAEEGKEFTTLKGNCSTVRPRATIEYILTLDIAKEICMISGIAPRSNEETKKLSKQARRYFIDIEKKYKDLEKKQFKEIAQREAGKIVRNMLTDTIKEKVPESPHKKFAYPNYTKLIYKILFNKTVNELRIDKNIPKNKTLRDFFNADELKEIQELENIITGLIALGMGYKEIKDILSQRYIKQIA